MKNNLRSLQIFLIVFTRILFTSCLFFPIVCSLTIFMGCSSSNYLQIDAHQPVYFGNSPKCILMRDSTQVKFVSPFVTATSHTLEKEKTVTSKNTSITTGGVEDREDNVNRDIRNTLEVDPDRFISDVSLNVRVEAHIPWYSVLSMFMIKGESNGLGEASTETIKISGKVYNYKKVKP